jgi:predicted amidohydrolase YtcJ
MKLFVSIFLSAAALVVHAAEPVTIFTAKKFITMERSQPAAQAVAVSGGRIVSVGSLKSVRAALGATPARIDDTFNDQIVMPGFIEQHMHPFLGAMVLMQEIIANDEWVLPERTFPAAATPAQYQARLRSAEKALGASQEWLFTWGYHRLWHGDLSRADLDAISTTRPIVVWQRSGHEFILNTAAIEALKLDRAAMADKGLASTQFDWDKGHWFENGASELLAPSLVSVMATPQRMTLGLQRMIAYYQLKGVTALNEPGVLLMPGLWALYQQVLGAPDVPFSSSFFPDARTQMNAGLVGAAALADTERKVAMGVEGKVAMLPKRIKLLADGAILSQAMQMQQGYTDGHHGEWMMPPEALETYGKLYWDAGYQLHIHVTGDLGLEVALDMLERRQRENPRADHRTVIVHFANSTEAQVARIARLGAIVSSNPYYPIGFGEKYAQIGLDPQRAHAMARQGSVIRHGIPLSFHSDLPVSPTDPLFQVWMAVTRLSNEGHVLAPQQRISVHDALRAITIEAAYSWGKEAELGSLAVGKVANFTVLSQDPYTVKPMAIKDIPIWGTVFEGRVFRNAPAPAKMAHSDQRAHTLAVLEQTHSPTSAHADSCGLSRQMLAALALSWADESAATPGP